MDLEVIAVVGATIQTMGVWALAALLWLVSRTFELPYIRSWARGWVWLACSLTALQGAFRIPWAAFPCRAIYLFGELAFVWHLYMGCRSFSDRESPPSPPLFLFLAGAGYALALPFLVPNFTSSFVVQSVGLSLGFLAVSFRLRASGHQWGGGLGQWVTQAGLLLLALDFAIHALALGLSGVIRLPLPDGYAHFTSLYDLVCEMILAFGLVVLTMQDASRQIGTLKRLVPVCAWCRKIRDDHGFWTEFEGWVKSHGRLDITHGICPVCKEEALKDLRRDQATS